MCIWGLCPLYDLLRIDLVPLCPSCVKLTRLKCYVFPENCNTITSPGYHVYSSQIHAAECNSHEFTGTYYAPGLVFCS
jgi:hypothetical protein